MGEKGQAGTAAVGGGALGAAASAASAGVVGAAIGKASEGGHAGSAVGGLGATATTGKSIAAVMGDVATTDDANRKATTDDANRFFSIWQFCILQISPFFVAFITGLYLATLIQKTDVKIMRWVIPPCITYTAGFTLIYSLLIASGLSFSRPLLTNIGSLRILAGVIILLASLYIFLVNRMPSMGKLHHPLLLSVLSMAIGISFAFWISSFGSSSAIPDNDW